jgi:chromosome segregation ATPase
MIKKALLVVGGLGLATVIFFGSDAASYVCTSYDRVTETVHANIPIEFQIERARKMVQALEPEIRKCTHVIATEKVAVEKLTRDIDRKEAMSGKDKMDLTRLHADLSSGKNVYRYSGHTYTADDVRENMTRRLERIKTTDSTLASLKKMRDARERHLDATVKKLTAMRSTQQQLRIEVENLHAKLKLVQVAQATSEFNFDDSALAKAKELITQIHTDLDVAAELVSARVEYHGEIQLDAPTPEDIDEQVASYLGLSGPDSAEFADASYARD